MVFQTTVFQINPIYCLQNQGLQNIVLKIILNTLNTKILMTLRIILNKNNKLIRNFCFFFKYLAVF